MLHRDMSKYTLRCIHLPLSPCGNGVLGNTSRYITIIVLLLFIQWSMSRDPPSTKRAIWALPRWKRREIEKPPIHTCWYFLIRAIPRAGLLLMDSEMNDRRRKNGRERNGKKVTCRRKIQVAAAAKTAITTHFVYAGVQLGFIVIL